MINEGSEKKGGIGDKPATGAPPNPPLGQSAGCAHCRALTARVAELEAENKLKGRT